MDNGPKETHAVSVMTLLASRNRTVVVRDEKDDRHLPHSIRRQSRLTGRKSTQRKILTRQVRLCVDIKIVITRRVNFSIFSCARITCLKKVVFLVTNADFDMLRQRRSPAKSQREVVRKD